MAGVIKSLTSNYNFRKIFFDAIGWADALNSNWDDLDTILTNLFGALNVRGTWTNSTSTVVGEKWIDTTDNKLYEVLVDHTTAASGSFADYRAANPTHYQSFDVTVYFAGTYATSTKYVQNAIVKSTLGADYGIVPITYTTGASSTYEIDLANGDIVELLHLKTIVDGVTTSETNASNSAGAAATSATNAAASASAANTSAGNAATSESNASASAGAANTSATNAATSESNASDSEDAAAASASAAASSGDWTTNVNMNGYSLYNGGIRRRFATYSGAAFTEADIGKQFSIAMLTYNNPELPNPADVPVGWYVILEMNDIQANADDFFVNIDNRTTEVFKGYSYPFYTFGRGETICFINDGTDYIVEPIRDCVVDQDDLMSASSHSSGLASGGANAILPQNQTQGNTTEIPIDSTTSKWSIKVPGMYRASNFLTAYNHAGLGAAGAAFAVAYIGDNSAPWQHTLVQSYEILNQGVPGATAEVVCFADRDDIIAGWYQMINNGRAYNSGTSGVKLEWRGRR